VGDECLETGRPAPRRPVIREQFRTCRVENRPRRISDCISRIFRPKARIAVRPPAEARFSVGLAGNGGKHGMALKFSLCSNERRSRLARWIFGRGGPAFKIVP